MSDYYPFIVGWLIVAGLCCIIGAVIGMDKGQAGAGLIYGLLLGPLGLLLIAVSDDERIQCPVCRELIHQGARVCPKCRTNMAKLPSQGFRVTQQETVERKTPVAMATAPPRIVANIPRVAAKMPPVATKMPRVVMSATRAVSKVTQALGQATQAMGQAPRNLFFRQSKEFTQSTKVLAPSPPKDAPREPRIVERAPRFFLHTPGEEVRGPFDLAQIQALLACGVITGETQFCREGEKEWNQTLNV